MIEIKNLTKKFGSNKILDNISFSVQKGEVLGFLGPNGAGKSTTMKIITSFWLPNSGSVKIDDVDVAKDSIQTKKRIGYLPEMVPLYEDMLVYEYLKFVAEVRGLDKQEVKKRISEVADECNIRKVLKKSIDELSKGYRQRVGLAQAIIHNPDVLILDEPTTGLDPNQIIEIRDLIKKIGKEKTVIFSTHILSEVQATCDRVVIINNGKIVGEGKPDELARKAGAKELIYIKIKGPRENVLGKLKEINNLEHVKIKDKESDGIYGYEITPKDGIDLRESLSIQVMKNNWSIFEMHKKKINFEEVFRELTK